MSNSNYNLAQANIARGIGLKGDPVMKDFFDQIDYINSLSEESSGFVWRYQTAEGDATSVRILDDPYIIFNMSVWDSIEALREFAFNTEHRGVLKRRKEWFVELDRPHSVLWWTPVGKLPTIDDALDKLELLKNHGPTAEAFTFAQMFEAPVVTK